MIGGLARSTGRIVTVEENVIAGGFGSAVSEMLEAAASWACRSSGSACRTSSCSTASATSC
jgi:transketolase C-terminal domain/subunit